MGYRVATEFWSRLLYCQSWVILKNERNNQAELPEGDAIFDNTVIVV